MRKLIIVLMLILYSQHLYSQWIDQSYNLIPTVYIRCSKFLNSTTGFLGGLSGRVLKTTNSGTNWNSTFISSGVFIWGLDFKNQDTGMVVGTFNENKYCYKTTDGGNNWIQVNFPNPKAYYSIKFLNKNNIICSGDSGLVIKSTNLGANWNVIQTPTNEGFGIGSLFVLDSLRCFVTGTNGVFLRSSNGGLNWDLLSLNSSDYFGSIFFTNSNTGYAGSSSTSIIKKTTNGGLFWTTLNIGSAPVQEISSIYFLSANTGYLTSFYNTGMGYQEVILKTVNGGTNWSNVTTTNRVIPLRTSYFISNDTGWVAGDAGFILKTTNGGLTYASNNNEVIPDFSLSQNYPNPFNPSTIINYQLTINGFVILNVYDVNGRLVKELVNKKQSAGNYSIDFDGSGLPSGTYVYRLQVGDFSETKKMVLLK